MFEDDAIDAFESLNRVGRANSFGASKPHDETKDTEPSSSMLQFDGIFNKTNREGDVANQKKDSNLSGTVNQPENLVKDAKKSPDLYADHLQNKCNLTYQYEHQKTNSRRKQMYEIGVHKGKYSTEVAKERSSSTYENLASDNPVAGKVQFIDRMNSYKNYGNIHLNAPCVTTENPLMQELRKKGLLINNVEEVEIGKKYLTGNTRAYSESETTELLDDAMRDFVVKKGNQYLSYGRSNTKIGEGTSNFQENPVFEEVSMNRPLDHHEIYKNHDIKTLADSLLYFGLTLHLKELETSLEDLRRNKKKKEDHENCYKQIDKEIQKLSFKYHPDKVKNRGGSETDIAKAQKLQTALNSTRTALKLLNSAFMEDIGTDHKFGFYTQLSIDSLCNEDEMKHRIYEVIFKIGVISRIKQQNIISEIRKFLIVSKKCVSSYLENTNEFEKHRDLAFFHLKCCVKGFKKLCAELDDIKEQCKSEKDGENMHSLIRKMAYASERDLRLLKSLKETAKGALKGKFRFFSPSGVMDPYFVLPLVSYINVILMCNVMRRSASVLGFLYNFYSETDPNYRDDLSYMMHPYYLASYCSGNKYHEEKVLKLLDKKKLVQQIHKEEIEQEFYKGIEQINEFMEYKFKVEDYSENMPTNLLVSDLKKCMTMMTEFEEKQQEVSKSIKEFQKKTEKMDEKYEKFDKMMEEAAELNQKIKLRLEQSKKFSEKVFKSLSDQQ